MENIKNTAKIILAVGCIALIALFFDLIDKPEGRTYLDRFFSLLFSGFVVIVVEYFWQKHKRKKKYADK